MQGLYSGSVIGRGEPLSLRSQKALGRDTSQHREQREQQDQALGTLATVSLIRARHQTRQQAAATAQEARFQGYVEHAQARRQTPAVIQAAVPARRPIPPAAAPPAQPPLAARPIWKRQATLLAPIPRLMLPTNQPRAIATATAALGTQRADQRRAVPATTPPPVDGSGYLNALQAHTDAEGHQPRPWWAASTSGQRVRAAAPTAATVPAQEPIPPHTVAEHVRAAGEPLAVSAAAQEPLPPHHVLDHLTRQATAPGTVITPTVYTRTVTPEAPETRIDAATAALHRQYQAQRTTSDTPPTEPRSVTRPRRRGPKLTTQTPKERR
jgi:hypothetical protein